MNYLRTIILSFAVLIASGCREEGNAVSVSGKVTVSGQPLSGATITWEPMGATQGPKATASIFDGNYHVDQSANLQPGTFRVRISMLPAEILAKVELPNGQDLPAPNSVIAKEFDSHSQLNVELAAGKENNFDCDVQFK